MGIIRQSGVNRPRSRASMSNHGFSHGYVCVHVKTKKLPIMHNNNAECFFPPDVVHGSGRHGSHVWMVRMKHGICLFVTT